MNRARASAAVLTTLAVVGAALLSGLALAGTAAAKSTCQVIPKSSLIPYLLTPCREATVAQGTAITFTVHDANPGATQYHPYLDLQTSSRRVHGHLPPDTTGDGVFAALAPVVGHAEEWTTTARHQIFPSWWDNHKGTYYVQVAQISSGATEALVLYSPVVTIHVG